MFVGLEHVAIASPNPPSLARWYVDQLGLRLILERDGNCAVRFTGDPYLNNGNRLVFFKDGEGNLCHLIQRKEPLP
jgi:catechol 2,3-dioxygenase-like lactoylglutathione lyase family enzyme